MGAGADDAGEAVRRTGFDFEYVLAQDRERYPELVALAARMFNEFDYQVSAALASKTSPDQPGLL